MSFTKPITKTISDRFSCRTYLKRPIEPGTRNQLIDFIAATQSGPFSNQLRFELVSATQADTKAMKRLGTYGVIKGATGFLIGAMGNSEKNLENFGYLMEVFILKATELGLGTCWLGGTFTKSRFAEKISLIEGEIIPAVTSLGYKDQNPRWVDGKIRAAAGSDRRLPWEKLFFSGNFDSPLSKDGCGVFASPLEMIRQAPSASNRQPWRIIKTGHVWHFYLRRTRGYRSTKFSKITNMADLQRVDMGIAMSHFELTLQEQGVNGGWQIDDPGIAMPELTEYSVRWAEKL